MLSRREDRGSDASGRAAEPVGVVGDPRDPRLDPIRDVTLDGQRAEHDSQPLTLREAIRLRRLFPSTAAPARDDGRELRERRLGRTDGRKLAGFASALELVEIVVFEDHDPEQSPRRSRRRDLVAQVGLVLYRDVGLPAVGPDPHRTDPEDERRPGLGKALRPADIGGLRRRSSDWFERLRISERTRKRPARAVVARTSMAREG